MCIYIHTYSIHARTRAHTHNTHTHTCIYTHIITEAARDAQGSAAQSNETPRTNSSVTNSRVTPRARASSFRGPQAGVFDDGGKGGHELGGVGWESGGGMDALPVVPVSQADEVGGLGRGGEEEGGLRREGKLKGSQLSLDLGECQNDDVTHTYDDVTHTCDDMTHHMMM